MTKGKMTSEQQALLMQYLEKMQALIYNPKVKETINLAAGQDLVLLIGNTRGGKSTIVNYLIGNRLLAIKEKRRYFRVELDKDSYGPAIGLGPSSETTIPTLWTSDMVKGVVVDAPSFDDNRGPDQDVANAFYIKELITQAKSVKFVLVSDINEILQDNINQFISFTDKIYSIMPECEMFTAGVVMVFNKDREQLTKEDVCDELKQKIRKQYTIQVKSRCLISFVIDNPEHLVITRMPSQEGPIYGEDVFGGLVEAINNSAEAVPKHKLAGATPVISDRSHIFLLEAHAYLTEFQNLDKVLELVQKVVDDHLEFLNIENDSSQREMLRAKKKLTDLSNEFTPLSESKDSLEVKLAQLSDCLPTLKELQKGGDIYMQVKFVDFTDQILKLQGKKIAEAKLNAALAGILNKVETMRVNLQETMSEISSEEARRRLYDLKEHMHEGEKQYYETISVMQQKQLEQLKKQKEERHSKSVCCVL